MLPIRVPFSVSAAVSALALATALPAPLLAQGTTTVELDEVVISALRTAAQIRNTGVAVSVLDRDRLEADGRTSLGDILANEPGLFLTNYGGFGGGTSLRLRGVKGGYLAVFVDGIRVDDPTALDGGFDFGTVLAGDIARVEILRGSQSALWGGSAVGGVISITSLGAVEEGLTQRVEIEAGSHNTLRLGYGLTQKTGALELALNATRFRTSGYSAARSGTEDDGAEASRLSFSARYQVSDALALGGSWFVQRTEQELDDFAPPTYAFGDADARQTRLERGARVFAEYAAGSTTHLFDLSWFDNARRVFDSNGGDYEGNRIAAGWQATTEVSPALTLVYGLDWTREEARHGSGIVISTGSSEREVAGAFAQGIWSPSEAFDVSLALRADQDSDFGSFFTGRLAAAWHPTADTTLRAAIARGYRAPTLDERFVTYSSWGTIYHGNPDLKPETSRSVELGYDQSFAGGASLSATIYRLEIDDKISAQPFGTDRKNQNVSGTSVSKGLELAGTLPVGAAASLGLSYSYTDARDANDRRVSGVPRHSLTLGADTALGDRLTAGLRITHVAGLLDNFAAVPELDPYTLVDARIGYDLTDSASLYLRIENLTDQDYTLSDGYGTPGRTFHVGLRAKF